MLKYDYCYAPWKRKAAVEHYTKMGSALKNSGRDIVFSVDGAYVNPGCGPKKQAAVYWRTTPDILILERRKCFYDECDKNMKRQKGLEKYEGPGHWNDPDMLTVNQNR